ncbi:MAG: hypothetical protein R3F65_18240 [bacterium]|nr:hypothetical protein [Myxococcales bacterium]
MFKKALLWLAFGVVLAAPPAFAGPIEDAKAFVKEGQDALDKAEKTRNDKKKLELLIAGLAEYARAYSVITSRKLENDAPDLLQEISDRIKEINERPEVVARSQEVRQKAIAALEEGRLVDAYDRFSELRYIDPRKWTVNYALAIIGQRMEGG